MWIDSGSSHAAVLRRTQGATAWPADLYLEGSDQHRGWFQSSLWTSVIAFGAAPYRAVLTHGFIVGEDGKKISKSGQYEKPPTSDNFVAQYGADVIRLWIASQDFTQDITLSEKILNNAAEATGFSGTPFGISSPCSAISTPLRTQCRWPRWTRSTAGRCTRRRV